MYHIAGTFGGIKACQIVELKAKKVSEWIYSAIRVMMLSKIWFSES